MRQLIILLTLLCGAVIPAVAQVSIGIGIGVPNMNIGINFPVYPQFQQVPGYPVYYAPQVDSNYFFYDGMYWVYANDSWYASSWYNGPWALVSPMVVPVYILRVPVRYYREPPVYFRGWRQDAPPRWDDHWGDDWRRQRSGWDHWNHDAVPPPAPLPTYQREYSGHRYPSYDQQRMITTQNYHYQPHEAVVQQHYQRYLAPTAPAVAQQRPPQHEPQQQPSAQDHSPPGQTESGVKPPQHQPPAPRQPPEQPPGQIVGPPPQEQTTAKHPQQQHQQQEPPGQNGGVPGQGANAPNEQKQDRDKDEHGDRVPDKETEHDNR